MRIRQAWRLTWAVMVVMTVALLGCRDAAWTQSDWQIQSFKR
jgi:hypothetical protein